MEYENITGKNMIAFLILTMYIIIII